jgi:hypothetical protein
MKMNCFDNQPHLLSTLPCSLHRFLITESMRFGCTCRSWAHNLSPFEVVTLLHELPKRETLMVFEMRRWGRGHAADRHHKICDALFGQPAVQPEAVATGFITGADGCVGAQMATRPGVSDRGEDCRGIACGDRTAAGRAPAITQ